MVLHDAPAADSHLEAFGGLGEDLFEGEKVFIFAEDSESAVGAVKHVVDVSARSYSF